MWTVPQFHTPEAGDRWGVLVSLALWLLYLARAVVIDQPLPWQKAQVELTPARVQRGLGELFCTIGTPLDVYEKMAPELAIVSTKQKESTREVAGLELKRGLFPRPSAVIALEECGAKIVTTDGSYEAQIIEGGQQKDPARAHEGSIVVVVPPEGRPRWTKLDDGKGDIPEPPLAV
jgi:hypothetical protein